MLSFFKYGLPYKQLNNLRGRFIVIEGTDGVGRTTQVELLRYWVKTQGYGVAGDLAESLLLKDIIHKAKDGHRLNIPTFALLHATEIADHLENEIIPSLQTGMVVIKDRYVYTAMARNNVVGVDPVYTRKLLGFGLIPDLVCYLKIDIDTLIKRVLDGRGIKYWESGMFLSLSKDLFDSFYNYQKKLIDEFDTLAKEFNFVSIDATTSIESIQFELQKYVGKLLNNEVITQC